MGCNTSIQITPLQRSTPRFGSDVNGISSSKPNIEAQICEKTEKGKLIINSPSNKSQESTFVDFNQPCDDSNAPNKTKGIVTFDSVKIGSSTKTKSKSRNLKAYAVKVDNPLPASLTRRKNFHLVEIPKHYNSQG